MCHQTDCLHLGCQHRFAYMPSTPSTPSPASPTNNSFSSTDPVAFQYCAPLIEHRLRTQKLNFLTRLFHNHYKPCQNFCLETRVVEGLCPTCEWQEKERVRVKMMLERGEKRERTLGLVRTDDWDEDA